jgi:hypothetical protein
VIAESLAAASSFDADEADFLVVQEVVEDSDRVRAAADAGDDGCWQFAFGFENLGAGIEADAGMKIAEDRGDGVGGQEPL